ncbi:MAG: hypothetical protein QOJ97_1369 [Solirubrobacteraceae bacterium]|jgi:hypothetical protein|nr:hypothetical protein [Solirubrobacteraceae bacterium]
MRSFLMRLACASVLLLLTAPAAGAATSELYVSPNGSDSAPGTREAPLQTIDRALAQTTGGETVYLLPGTHASFRDLQPRLSFVTVRPAPGATEPPVVAGGYESGGTYVRFQGLRFTGRLHISVHPKFGAERPSHDIEVLDSRFTHDTWGYPCLTVRAGAHHVLIARNTFDRCAKAITGPGDGITDPALRVNSHHITISDNTIEHAIDGLQFAHWDDVRIEGNRLYDFGDPAGVEHSDGIQVMGNTHRVRIAGNTIHHGGQLVFLQGAVVGPNDDVELSNNLIYDSSNYAVKIGSTSNLRIVNNTVWGTRYGGVILREGTSDATVVNNVLDLLGAPDGWTTYRDYNWLGQTWDPAKAHETVGQDPRFVDPAAGDYRLLPDSGALYAGAPDLGPAVDILGAARIGRPTLGAYQAPFAPAGWVGPAPGPNRADAPIGYWRFDEAAGAQRFADSSGHGNLAAIAGSGVTGGAPGATARTGGAVELAGGGYLEVPDAGAKLDPATGLTVEAWVWTPTSVAAGAPRSIVAKNFNSGYRLRLDYAAANAGAGASLSAYDQGSYNQLYRKGNLAAGTWALVAWTADAAGSRLYVNGRLIAANATPYRYADNAAPLRIGGGVSGSAPEAFSGRIDELALYDRALSAEQLAGHYAAAR